MEAIPRRLTRSDITYVQMLQLDLACKVEHPHLQLPQLSPEQLMVMFQVPIVNYQMINQRSRYDVNVHFAASHLLGYGDLIRRRALSLSGYELDTEVLLDADNKPLAVPKSCYNIQVDRANEIIASRFQLKGASFQQAMEECDRGGWLVVASDWGVEPEEVRARVARRVVFEADGPTHYAVNCHHPLGHTVLKHRQLRALGWDVISVSGHVTSRRLSCDI